MNVSRFRPWSILCCAVLFTVLAQSAAAETLCVNRHGSNGCYTKIQTAVNHAPAGAIIRVASGHYDEQVTIGVPLSLLGLVPTRQSSRASRMASSLMASITLASAT